MDILVIIMLALFLIIIAFMVVIYVIVRRNSVDKKFDRTIDSDLNNLDDDDDDDDFVNLNIVMPSRFKNNEEEKIEEEVKEEIKEYVQVENNIVEPKVVEKENISEEVKKIEPVSIIKNKEKIEELINVLINKKNYIFLANNNVVSKNDYIKLILDGKVYFGVVTKANYKKDISQFKVKPRKLIVVKKIVQNEHEKKDEGKVIQEEIVEFIPKKKERM